MSLLNVEKQYRLRVEICIGTIIDAHKHIKTQYKNEAFISQFEGLRRVLEYIDMQGVSEKDIIRVEKATNDLLCEFKPLVEQVDRRNAYSSTVH